MSSNLKFKPHGTYNTTIQVQDFIQPSTVHSETLFNTVIATVTPGVSQSSSPKEKKRFTIVNRLDMVAQRSQISSLMI
jgi:hypothetical protein